MNRLLLFLALAVLPQPGPIDFPKLPSEKPNILELFHKEVLPAHEQKLVDAWQEYFFLMEGWSCSIELERIKVILGTETFEFYTIHKATVICQRRGVEGKKVISAPVVWDMLGRWGYFYKGDDLKNGAWELLDRTMKPQEEDAEKLKPPEEETL